MITEEPEKSLSSAEPNAFASGSTAPPTSPRNLKDDKIHRSPMPNHRSRSPNEQMSLGRYGPSSHLTYHDRSAEPEQTYRLRDLVRPPVIRQWIEGGKIYREPSPREVPRFELFFDLLFVAIIHQLADAAIEEPGGPAVARFVLTFWPSWSIWEEARRYSNVSGTDDVVHRFWVLIGMACILGYSVNATGIELNPPEDQLATDNTAVRAAVAFYLIIKLTRVVVLFIYAYKLPQFRISQIMSGIAVLIPMFCYLPLIWVTDRRTQIALAAIAIFVDLMRIDAILYNAAGRWIRYSKLRDRKRRASESESEMVYEDDKLRWFTMVKMPDGFRIAAVNIEHSIERSAAFVVIVLGELVMNLLYTAVSGSFGASLTYGRAILGLMVAWALNWLYMLPADVNNDYEHALRRSWLSAISFSFLHWPLCASLVLASAASGKMVGSEEVEPGVNWYWGCGLGFAVLFMAILDMTHRNLAPMTDARVPRPIRFGLSFLASLALILFPLCSESLTSVAMLATAVGIIWLLLGIQVIGIMPRPSKWIRTADGHWTRRENEGASNVEHGQRKSDTVEGGAVAGAEA